MTEVEKILRKECFSIRIEYLVESDTGKWTSFREWTIDDAEDFIEEQNESCDLDDIFGGTRQI